MKKIFLSVAVLLLSGVMTFGATLGEANALMSAKDYLEAMPLSRKGLFDMLTKGAGFTEMEAEYALENSSDVDWKEQAARAAKDYLEAMPLSRKGLFDMLTKGAGFTKEEAEYGVKQAGY